MPPEPVLDDEDYASSEDSDFAPDEAPEQEIEGDAADDDCSADEVGAQPSNKAATAVAPAGKRRRAGDVQDAEDAGFENSGDEAIIEKGKKRRKKGKAAQRDDGDEGGEGGLIKTRSMRAVEKAERKTQAATGPVTVDVDALWASMTAAPVVPAKQEQEMAPADQQEGAAGRSAAGGQGAGQQRGPPAGRSGEPSEMIKIKRTYNFAGKVHAEEKLVARDSAEARLYLASRGGKHGDPSAAAAAAAAADDEDDDEDRPDKRMPRKAFRSAFEPVLALDSQRADLNLGIAVRLQARESDKAARKLNTVEKSRMDWAGFVDKEGIKDELALAGRAKGAFADRQDFLARTEARREDDARRVRLAGKT